MQSHLQVPLLVPFPLLPFLPAPSHPSEMHFPTSCSFARCIPRFLPFLQQAAVNPRDRMNESFCSSTAAPPTMHSFSPLSIQGFPTYGVCITSGTKSISSSTSAPGLSTYEKHITLLLYSTGSQPTQVLVILKAISSGAPYSLNRFRYKFLRTKVVLLSGGSDTRAEKGLEIPALLFNLTGSEGASPFFPYYCVENIFLRLSGQEGLCGIIINVVCT